MDYRFLHETNNITSNILESKQHSECCGCNSCAPKDAKIKQLLFKSLLGANTDILKGGLADNMPDDAFDSEELAKGIKHELEHTDDEDMAKEIAKDHLAEIPNYYTMLDDLEKSIASEMAEDEPMEESEYQGRDVDLNKPFRTPDGPKKFAVYVNNEKGNVIRLPFGSSEMEIKRDDPDRRRGFRARHNCDNPGPRYKARYWSCKFWSTKSVTDLLGESKKTKDISTRIRKANTEKEFDALYKEIDDLAYAGEIKFKEATKLMQSIDIRKERLGMMEAKMNIKKINESLIKMKAALSEGRLAPQVANVFDKVQFARKTDSFKNMERFSKGKLTHMLQAVDYDIDQLPKVSPKELYGREITKDDSPVAMDFVKPQDQFFILQTKFGEFLIDTQGYDYARYIVKLK